MQTIEFKNEATYRSLKNDILSGKYQAMSKLPKEEELSKALHISRITLRSALERLENDGLIERIPSKGTFVTPRRNTTRKIMIVYSNMANPWDSDLPLSRGLEKFTAQNNAATVITKFSDIAALAPERFGEIVKDQGISGIAANGMNFTGTERFLRSLQNCGVPVVLPNASAKDHRLTGLAVVGHDDKKAWTDSIDFLVRKGHRRIAAIAWPGLLFRGHDDTEHFAALAGRGASDDRNLLKKIRLEEDDRKNISGIKETVEKWAETTAPPTAILCHSDQTACLVCRALNELGIRIPRDMAVMGCSGCGSENFCDPPLTTIAFDYDRQAETALRLLMEKDQWFGLPDVTPPFVIVPHTLREGQSANIKHVNIAGVTQ